MNCSQRSCKIVKKRKALRDVHCPVTGNATELALLKWTNRIGAQRIESVETLPFDSKYKYMATSHRINGKKRIFVKGAPDVIMTKVSAAHIDGTMQKFDRLQWGTSQLIFFASEGQRVIAFAYKDVGKRYPINP